MDVTGPRGWRRCRIAAVRDDSLKPLVELPPGRPPAPGSASRGGNLKLSPAFSCQAAGGDADEQAVGGCTLYAP